jgi:hypothetical protein
MERELKQAVLKHLQDEISNLDADVKFMPEVYKSNDEEEARNEYLQHPHASIFIYNMGSVGSKKNLGSHTNSISIGLTIYGNSESHPRYGTEALAERIRAILTVFCPELNSGVVEPAEWVATDPLPSIDDGTILLGMKFNYNGLYFNGQ